MLLDDGVRGLQNDSGAGAPPPQSSLLEK